MNTAPTTSSNGFVSRAELSYAWFTRLRSFIADARLWHARAAATALLPSDQKRGDIS